MIPIYPAQYCLHGDHGAVTSVAFTADGNHILSASEDGTLRLWHLVTQQEVFGFQSHAGTIYAIATPPHDHPNNHPNDHWVAAASSTGEVTVWDTTTRRPLAQFDHGLATRSHSLVCSADGRFLLMGNDDGLLWRWDWRADEALCLIGHTRPVVGVAMAAAGERVVSLGDDATLCLWHLPSSALHKTIQLDSNYSEPLGLRLALSPTGWLAATSSSAVAVDLWDLASGQRLNTLDHMVGNVLALAFLPDGQHLLTAGSVEGLERAPGETCPSETAASDHTIRLWAIASGQEVAQFVGHSDSINALTLSPNGRYFVSGSSDQTARVWSFPNPQRWVR